MVFSSQRIIPIAHQTIPDPTSPPSPIPSTTAPTISGGGGTALQVALDYACGYGGADCSAIQPGGGSCSDPDTVRDHASYAFNDYYQKNPAPTSCVFGGTAQLTYTDPSHGNCRYASSTSSPMNPAPPTTIPTIPLPPPSITTPVMPYTPGEGNGYGSEPTGGGYDYASGFEPTGTPSSASDLSLDLLLLISLVVVANYF
ncbi:hypothetical protein ACJIZ3_008329 [Penstemon smallii]|uniref:X8 domain-containing protein n=1 Tax=Penstemon smallii TaxID=265156 RepID=A0ABD3TAZ1_9LAMI